MNFQTCGFDRLAEYESNEFARVVSTAILSVTYRISSELRSQATAGLVSTTVGDHVGIRGAVGSSFCSVFLLACRPFFKQSYNSQFNNSSRGHTHLTNGRHSLWGIFPNLKPLYIASPLPPVLTTATPSLNRSCNFQLVTKIDMHIDSLFGS